MKDRLEDSRQNKCPKVTVVIVNWNGEKFLNRCLSALMIQSVKPYEIILVDNASTDASLDIVHRFPSVRLLLQTENLGFAAGNNLAIQAACEDADWIALLNTDAYPDPAWLESLLSAVRDYPDFDALGSKLVDANDPALLDGAGDAYHVSGLVWRICHGEKIPPVSQVREVFSPCAAAALYRRSAFRSVNGFDEDFFCYMEDVDLGFRLRLSGFRCLYVPDSVVYHVGSATTGHQHSAFAVYHGHRNLVWTYIKNMPGVLFWLLLPVHLLMNVAACIYFSLIGQGMVILKAKWDAIKGIRKVWAKRRHVQAGRRISVGAIWRMLDKRIMLLPISANSRFSKGAS